MKTAVIYARYSSDNQSEQSIEGQLHVCEDYAKNNDIILLDTYIDRAMTGTNDNRPAFQQMLKDSKKREWDYVLVYKFDRFSRNKYETAIHKKTLRDNGVKLMSATEYLPDTPERIIIESMFEGYAEYYSAELSQKVRRGMKETRLKGNFTGGNVLFGYKVENHKVIIDDTKAEVVRYIYSQYASGVYVKDIIDSLTAKGIFNKGKPFARNTIYNILKNEKYSGIYRHKGEVFDNMYPAIIDDKTFDKVRKLTNKNKYGKRSTEVSYLLSTKTICGYCGERITGETGTSKLGDVKRYYKCFGRKRKNGCKKTMVRKDPLEKLVADSIIQELNSPKTIDSIVKALLKMQDSNNKNNPLLSLLIKERNQTETVINNIMDAIEKGVVTNTTTKRLKENEQKLEDLERKIIIEKSKTNVQLTEKEIRQFYEKALHMEAKMLIHYLVKQIVLYDDKIEIRFYHPLTTSSDESQGFSFYSKQKHLVYKTKHMPTIKYKMQIEMFV